MPIHTPTADPRSVAARIRQVAVGAEIAGVVGRAGLGGRRSAGPAGRVAQGQLLGPDVVLGRVRVAGQDVADHERGLGRDRALALRASVPSRRSAVAARGPRGSSAAGRGCRRSRSSRTRRSGRAVGPRPSRAPRPGPDWRNASRPPMNRMPIRSAVSATRSLPTRSRARMAGMLSEYWSALRTRTGPRSQLVGVARRPVLALDRTRWSRRAAGCRASGAWLRTRRRTGSASRPSPADERRLRRRRTSARTPCSRGRPARSRHCRRRPARRRSRNRWRRAQALCRSLPRNPRIQPRSPARDLQVVEHLLACRALPVRGDGRRREPALGEPLGPPVEGRDRRGSRRARCPRPAPGSTWSWRRTCHVK